MERPQITRKVSLQMDSFEDYLRARVYVVDNKPAEKVQHTQEELEAIYARAIELFNTNAKSAFVFLTEQNVIEGTPIEAAHFIIDYAGNVVTYFQTQ